MPQVEFWFEFASTYSYPAAFRVEERARSVGVALAWRPFLLGPIFKQSGWDDSPFNLYPAKGRYMWRDLERTCQALNLSFRRPSQFPRNGLSAARIACAFQDEPWLPEFVKQIYAANFARDADISSPDVLQFALSAAGAPEGCVDAARAEDAKTELRLQTARAEAAGVFGAPTFRVGEELFWGNDRLEAALAWAKKLAASGA